MQFTKAHDPAHALAICHLEPGDAVLAESGALVTRDAHLEVESTAPRDQGVKGLLKKIGRKMLAEETLVRSLYVAGEAPGEVTFAPRLPGDILIHEMTGGELVIQQSAYLASSREVAIETRWGGFRGLFGQGRVFWIRASGTGQVALNAFGAVEEIDVDGTFIIDTGYIIAFEPSLSFDIKRVGSWFFSVFSDEGPACRFKGKGKLYIQTRNPDEFGTLVGGKLPPRNS